MSRTLLAARRVASGSGVPVNTVPPTISGTVAHGNILTATPGTWTGSPSITVQWYAGASPISGATGATYTVDRAEGGYYGGIFYRENDSVSATSADSNALAYDYLTALGTVAIAHDMAEDVTVVTGEIDSMLDQGPNSNTIAAPTSNKRPAYAATDAAFNSQPTGTGDGIDDTLRIAAATTGGTVGPGALVMVGKLDVNTNGRVCMAYAGGGTAWKHAESTTSRVTSGLGASTVIESTSFTTAARCLISVADGTNVVRYVNGAAAGTPVAYTGTLATGQNHGLFAFSNDSLWSHVIIAFAMLLRSAPSAAQAADFGQYSRERWGTA